jgi:hypothetical protein
LRHSRFALDTRIATVVLAMVLAVVSMPIMCGWVVTDARAAITMDICHPAQSIDVSHAALFAPAPPLLSIDDGSRDAVLAIGDSSDPVAGRLGEAPELPPPETRA